MADIVVASQPWYRALDRAQWNALIASNLGWLFDGYETYALILTVGFALRQLLDPAQFPEIPFYAGLLIAITLLGWGMGGLIGGVMADYLGRKRTMMLAILAYSLATGLSAFAWDATSFAVLRFLVGVAIGSEWVTGASIVSELWPDHARGRGVALMQCGLGLGFFLASLLWVVVGDMGPNAWRAMFLIGVLPALLTLWVRRAIPESNLWERVNDRRRAVVARQRSGAALQEHEQALARFTLVELFHDAEIRRRTLIAFLMSLATMFGLVGNHRLGAALHRRRRSEGRPARAAMGWLRRNGLQSRRHRRLCGVRFPDRLMGAQADHHGLFRGAPWCSCRSFSCGRGTWRSCSSPPQCSDGSRAASSPGCRLGCRNSFPLGSARPAPDSCSTRPA